MKIGTQQMLKILTVISWIIFVGVCLDAGGVIVNTFFALVVNPDRAKYFWGPADLSSLLRHDRGYFLVITLIMSIVAVLKTIMFYLILKVLHEKKLNLSQPFSLEMGRFIFLLSYLSFGIGLFSLWGVKHSEWLVKQGVTMPDIQYLNIGGGDVWIFMGVILFVIALIFKRGIEIQTENEYTV